VNIVIGLLKKSDPCLHVDSLFRKCTTSFPGSFLERREAKERPWERGWKMYSLVAVLGFIVLIIQSMTKPVRIGWCRLGAFQQRLYSEAMSQDFWPGVGQHKPRWARLHLFL
jgi:hypothetical protein